MSKIRVQVVDDHAVLRAGLRVLINGQRDMEVAGEAGDAAGAVSLARRCPADVVLLDITMPGGSGLEVIGKILDAAPSLRVLILTIHDDQTYLRSALACGACGYLVKRSTDSELMNAIRTVARGRSYIDVSLGGRGLRTVVSQTPARRPEAATHPLELLSQREREVLSLLAAGHTNQETADRLALSVKSVETYRRRLSEKLGITNRAGMVRFALEVGLLRPAVH